MLHLLAHRAADVVHAVDDLLDAKTAERDEPGAASQSYVVRPAAEKSVRAWYDDAQLHAERPAQLAPDGWTVLERTQRGEREVLVIKHQRNDAVIEVAYRRIDEEFRDVTLRSFTAEEAYAVALDEDEKARERGFAIYNRRHPRP